MKPQRLALAGMLLLLFLAALVAFGSSAPVRAAAGGSTSPPPGGSIGGPPGGLPGRYQIVISPHLRAETFLVDTQTGRTWIMTRYDDLEGKPSVWHYQDKVDNLDELREWSKLFKPAGKRRGGPESQ